MNSRSIDNLSIILSFYNESDVIPELLSRLRKTLVDEIGQGTIKKYELIFVNDASTDISLDLLKAQADKYKDICIITMSRNFGVSECVLAGMEYSKGDAIIYMDSDLQDPPELIPDLLSKWYQEPQLEVIHTTRLSRAGESRLKLFVTRIGYRVIKSISNIDIPENTGDFKLLSRKVVNFLVGMNEKKPFLRGMVCSVGFPQGAIYYDRDARFNGSENTKFKAYSWRVINNALDSAIISFSDVPLKIILFLGFFISLLSLSYIVIIFIQKFLGLYTPGWPAIMAAVLLLGGFQMMMLGIVGLYIANIYINTKNRPSYIIQEIYK